MRRIVVVRVDHMASRAAAGTVVAGMIVGARKRKDGIEQAGLLQAEENGVGAKLGSKPTVAQLIVGLAWRFLAEGIADLALFLATSFEDPEHVAGLRSFPAE